MRASCGALRTTSTIRAEADKFVLVATSKTLLGFRRGAAVRAGSRCITCCSPPGRFGPKRPYRKVRCVQRRLALALSFQVELFSIPPAPMDTVTIITRHPASVLDTFFLDPRPPGRYPIAILARCLLFCGEA